MFFTTAVSSHHHNYLLTTSSPSLLLILLSSPPILSYKYLLCYPLIPLHNLAIYTTPLHLQHLQSSETNHANLLSTSWVLMFTVFFHQTRLQTCKILWFDSNWVPCFCFVFNFYSFRK